MGPFEIGNHFLISIAIGFGFGYILESSGFGDSRRLAAQFYLTEMRVLKVMFTAIVVAMVLVFTFSRLGLLDFSAVWVPPTYLGPGLLGGFLLGIGFIVGGFCPGTSMVASATGKLDGIFFVVGLMIGMFVFHDVADSFILFYQHSGAEGRLTLMDWSGLSTGVIVFGVVLMAVGAFSMATLAERVFGKAAQENSTPEKEAETSHAAQEAQS